MSYYPHHTREVVSGKLRDPLACRLVSRTFMDVCTARIQGRQSSQKPAADIRVLEPF